MLVNSAPLALTAFAWTRQCKRLGLVSLCWVEETATPRAHTRLQRDRDGPSEEDIMTLMGFEPFHDVDRAVEQALGTNRRTRAVALEAYRRGDQYVVVADVPGTDLADVEVRVERNVVTITVQRRPTFGPDDVVLIDERPRGEFVRQLFLGESLDSSKLSADFGNGVLTLRVPVDESSKPRRVDISSAPSSPDDRQTVTIGSNSAESSSSATPSAEAGRSS
ncbi:Hsp20/alpha crystallin family protein [Leifsonia sp. NPDC058230]|uniref:Hsp20/alpha crystallin family protein n=1 Tax=Leifsonia sp. NPDC058230 TaxID=3346391 RepID=UPI0036DB0165